MNYPPRSLPLAVLAAAFILHPSSFLLAQGSLTPPGVPAATMKTLQQIEPRTDLQATPAPSGVDTSNANYHFIINQPGSYYLSANLGATTTGMGFDVGANSIIEGCTAYANEGDGINLSSGTLARANTCISNGLGGDGAGIHATSPDNRIEGNNVTANDRGIDVDVAGNIILKNSASGNTTNYALAANNVFGEIVNRTAVASAAVSGNTAASSAGTTDPWANFAY